CTANPVSRSYDFPCGEIRTTVCKDSADTQPNSGEMDWMLPMGHPNAKDHDCFQEASGQWCCPGYTCTWRGLDRNTGSGRGGAADCVAKWRHQTCISPGLREGKHGRVISCGNANGDTYVAAEASWDLADEVE